MTSIEEITALIKQIENAEPLIKSVEELAVDQDDMAAWDSLVALAQAAQHMIDEHIYYDRASFHDCFNYSVQRQQAKVRGFETDPCIECGNYTLVRSGMCRSCRTCGAVTGGCA
jgi:hypothetical protein